MSTSVPYEVKQPHAKSNTSRVVADKATSERYARLEKVKGAVLVRMEPITSQQSQLAADYRRAIKAQANLA